MVQKKYIEITIEGTNDLPVISGDLVSTLIEDSSGENLTASGVITITDVDAGESAFVPETINGTYGNLTVDVQGQWTYIADNSQSAIQELGTDDRLTEIITVTSVDGTIQQIEITIEGTNDIPNINGDLASTLIDDGSGENLTASGIITITDVDAGESAFIPETINGTYGSLTINAEGHWTYSAGNNQSTVQELGAGDRLTDTLIVFSADGTTQQIEIIIEGTNDIPIISGDLASTLIEDSSGENLTASGVITITDTDVGESAFVPETINGTYGNLTVDAQGQWTYIADNSQSAIQELGTEDRLTEIITVTSVDGTTQQIEITIEGTNDIPNINGDLVSTLIEDSSGENLTASGVITITDVDAGESAFVPETINGTYGNLTVDVQGQWTYIADNSQSAIQELGTDDRLTEIITVTSVDGTTQQIEITIEGTNDIPVISGDVAGLLMEDSSGENLTVSGVTTITDVDANESAFIPETINGTYGSLTVDAQGQWTYSVDNTSNTIQTLGEGEQFNGYHYRLYC